MDVTTVTESTSFDATALEATFESAFREHVEGKHLDGYDVRDVNSISVGDAEKGQKRSTFSQHLYFPSFNFSAW